MSYSLYIDDLRPCPPTYTLARSSEEAIELIKEKGMPSIMSLDHDLGGSDTVMIFIDWLIENHYNDKVPIYFVHSSNPPGVKNIISKMESWKKSQSL